MPGQKIEMEQSLKLKDDLLESLAKGAAQGAKVVNFYVTIGSQQQTNNGSQTQVSLKGIGPRRTPKIDSIELPGADGVLDVMRVIMLKFPTAKLIDICKAYMILQLQQGIPTPTVAKMCGYNQQTVRATKKKLISTGVMKIVEVAQ